jgi:hypothetical protein
LFQRFNVHTEIKLILILILNFLTSTRNMNKTDSEIVAHFRHFSRQASLPYLPKMRLRACSEGSPGSVRHCALRQQFVLGSSLRLGGGGVIMKGKQCSEAESIANHPAFSAPGITRHRLLAVTLDTLAFNCCVIKAFLLSNPRWLSNIYFQIGFRLQVFAFRSAVAVRRFRTRDWVWRRMHGRVSAQTW